MCWHYDHSKGRAVQGFNLLNCLYHVDDISIPVAFELITKPIVYCDLKTRKVKRRSLETKNELMRKMVKVCVQNQLKFRYVLFDIWFSAKENMIFIKEDLKKDFICGLKKNRQVALSKEDYQAKRFTRIENLDWSEEIVITGWLKDVPFPVHLVRQIYTNKMAAQAFSIWPAVIQPYCERLFLGPIKNDGPLKSSINHSNKMLLWVKLQFGESQLKIIMFLLPCLLYLNWNV